MVYLMSIEGLAFAWLGSWCVVASVAWVVGRWSVKRTFEKEVRKEEIVREQKKEIVHLGKVISVLDVSNKDMKGALHGIVALATNNKTIG